MPRRIFNMPTRECAVFSVKWMLRIFATVELQFKAPEELALAKHLMNFGQTLEMVAQDYRPNFLCNYLFELAGHFSRFYEACPVLKAEAS